MGSGSSKPPPAPPAAASPAAAPPAQQPAQQPAPNQGDGGRPPSQPKPKKIQVQPNADGDDDNRHQANGPHPAGYPPAGYQPGPSGYPPAPGGYPPDAYPHGGYQPGSYMGYRQPPSDERTTLHNELDKIAIDIAKNPPAPLPNSQSYTQSYENYKARSLQLRTRDELRQWFDQQKYQLIQETVDYMLKAKYNSPADVKVTQNGQKSEYQLRMSALCHCYKDIENEYDAEMAEDMQFLSGMMERVRGGRVHRPDVLNDMDSYSINCRKRPTASGRSAASWSTGVGGVPRAGPPPGNYPRSNDHLRVGGSEHRYGQW